MIFLAWSKTGEDFPSLFLVRLLSKTEADFVVKIAMHVICKEVYD